MVTAPAVAASRADWDACKGDDPDRSIAACTRIIQGRGETAKDSAIAHHQRGLAYRSKGNFDRAIADFSEAIRLDPNYAEAYYLRGVTYGNKGDLDRAIADYSEAIRLDPKLAAAYNNRGNAYKNKGDLDRAIADYSEAIRLDPKDLSGYLSRGRANLYTGALATALADFNQASALDPKDAYAALWHDIANKRGNLPSRLADAVAQIDLTQWPAPVIRLYLGQMTPEAVLAAADNPDADPKNGRICEANFYTGERDLQQGKKDDAIRLFRLAAASCPKGFVEYEGANAELKALGAAQ